MTVVRDDAPVSLANAFLRPVTATAEYDLAEAAIVKLDKHFGELSLAYGQKHVRKVQTLVVSGDLQELNVICALGNKATSLDSLIDTTVQSCFGDVL